ncbi:concanavalin A-like lectin/glucanase domain-containing protein [Podospora didyma]|uniref:Concanavalin A-like lectin/glucanase domain-containing protein n=1 Tax=Podospora didyma TaxID=330526 RepID=A0AAE0TWE8_9PEZI|nr:concanavalin A-like lectin/glucanase domain-containing protein [Podospora didyma]
MKFTQLATIATALVTQRVYARPEPEPYAADAVAREVIKAAPKKFAFTVEAHFKGKPLSQSEIKIDAIDPVVGTRGRARQQKPSDSELAISKNKNRRSNPTVASGNWCGSVNHTPSSNQIKVIHAYFQHPACTKRPGVTTYPQAAAAWTGIDGDIWTSSLLQSGTVCKIDNSSGAVRNEAWWQWVPSGAYTITSMPVAAGDWFEVTINTTSSTSAKVTLSNISQGYSYTMTISGGAALGRVDADWVVERPYYGSSLAGFAKFTDVWFESAYATLANGANLGILGANQLQIAGTCTSAEYDNADLYAFSP